MRASPGCASPMTVGQIRAQAKNPPSQYNLLVFQAV